ncbi:AfsR/SARP family transcriptional regulator [Frankia sp. EAN1pec]|uniref:BTAD domain-containing putative transcriptional regulator n=1 Tax=Parafrankia sp. (strain EAN1pec) TaxID=298653 RepID=UPI00059E77BC
MKFRILGPVESEVDSGVRAIPGERQRRLLATLLVSGNRPVPAEQLYAELWGEDPPPTVENALQAHVYRLRRTLQRLAGPHDSPPALVTRTPGYLLEIDPVDLDMNIFRERIAQSRAVRTTDPGFAVSALDEALDLWRGSPLQDVAAGPICQSVSLQLNEEHVTALEDKLWLSIEHEDPVHVIGDLKRMSSVHPWRERITEMLMLALYRCGRQAEAVEAYNDVRRRLDRELGMEPSVQLKERFQEILNQASSLH